MSAELAIVIKASAVVGAAQSALAALGGSTRALTQSIRQAETATAQLKRRLENPAAGAQVDRLKRSYDGLNRTLNSLKGTQSRLEKLTAKQQGLKETRANILSGWHSAVGAASAMIMPVKLAIDFESAMADVKKVVNFDTPQQFQEMERDILKLTRSIPMTGEELAAIVAAGGQSGVARENLIGFASDAAKMGVAFDMAAGQAGEAMATLSNVLQIPIPKIGVLGDAINHLSDNANSNAADIVNVLTRVGSDIKQLGLTENQGAALGSTFLSMGKAPELAAQAIKGMVTSLSILKAGGGKKELAELGLTTESFAKAMNEDAQGAIQDLMRRLKQLPKDAQYPLLLKMFGKNYADDVLLLANNTEEYNRQLDLLTEKDADGNLKYIGSMGREFDNRSATTANQLQLLKSSVAELGIDIGKVLLPPLNELVQSVRPLITGLTDWLRANPQVAKGLIKVALAVASFVAGSFFARLALNLFQSNLIVFSLRALKLRSALFQGKAAFQVFRAGALLGNGALLRQRNLAGTTYRAFARLARGYRNTNNALKAYLANTAKRGAQAVMGFRFAKIRLPKFRLPKLSFASALSGGAGVLKNLSSLILRGLLSPLKLLAGAFRAVAVAMRLLAFNPFGLLIAALMLAAVAVYTYWEPIKAFFAGFWQGLKQGLAPLMPLFEGFMRLMAQVGSAVMDGLGGVWAFIQPLVQPIIDWFSDFFAVSSEAETKAASFGEALGLWVGGAISGLVGLVSTAWNNITGFFSSGIANISATILNWSPVGLFYQAFAAVMGYFGIELPTSLTGFVSAAVHAVSNFIMTWSPVTAFQTAFAAVWGFLAGLPARFTAFGSQIIQGLANGITAGAGLVVSAISNMASSAMAKAKSMFGIHSPSRVFRSYGDFITRGLDIGIGKGAAKPVAAVGHMAGRLKQRFADRVGQLRSDIAARVSGGSGEFAAARAQREQETATAANGAITVNFSPTIHAPGGDPDQIQKALQMGLREFEELFRRMMADRERRAY